MKFKNVVLSYVKENEYLPDEETVVFKFIDADLTEEGNRIFIETNEDVSGIIDPPILQKDEKYLLRIPLSRGDRSLELEYVSSLSADSISRLEFQIYLPKAKFISF
ncbi:hypothetical protein [Bacillus pumilus]|uniref:hypothetical protein n=1 Tax=Bacillus pumilus TaxID=1408 RepID=UPI0011AAC8DE|nr:hypothetical protein [Bacillus pumilus]